MLMETVSITAKHGYNDHGYNEVSFLIFLIPNDYFTAL